MQMPSGLPARVALVCTLVFGVSIARAERRPVAVIDLSGDPVTEKLAADLNPLLVGHPELQPIADASIPPELYGKFVDDDHDQYVKAGTNRENAEMSLARFELPNAEQLAGTGKEQLQLAFPSTKVLMLYSQLAFLRGQAMLGIPRQAADAPEEFALAHRLDSGFVPDAARYLPDVVQAFESAKKLPRWQGKGTLTIIGSGRVWIDGREQGTAPAEVEVDAGPHVVWLTGDDRTTSAKEVVVDIGKKTKLEIADTPVDMRLKVRRARAALRNAPDKAARGPAMLRIAKLVSVRDAILLNVSANGKPYYQVWTDGTLPDPGFSAQWEYKLTAKPSEKPDTPSKILEKLAPPKEDKPKQEEPKKFVDDRRWWQRRPVQASIAVGVVAALIGGYYLYKFATDDSFTLDNDIITAGRMRW